MGEHIFNFMLREFEGVPSLPVFIGNFLLDILSDYFIIFVMLSGITMFFNALIKGHGDWKNQMQMAAPTALSIAVIAFLLTLKTPYMDNISAEQQKTLNGNLQSFEGVNSYLIVDIMDTFLGLGNVFANALTHKIIYGKTYGIDPKKDINKGYFPSLLTYITAVKNSKIKAVSTEIDKYLKIINNNHENANFTKENFKNDLLFIKHFIELIGLTEDSNKFAIPEETRLSYEDGFLMFTDDKIYIKPGTLNFLTSSIEAEHIDEDKMNELEKKVDIYGRNVDDESKSNFLYLLYKSTFEKDTFNYENYVKGHLAEMYPDIYSFNSSNFQESIKTEQYNYKLTTKHLNNGMRVNSNYDGYLKTYYDYPKIGDFRDMLKFSYLYYTVDTSFGLEKQMIKTAALSTEKVLLNIKALILSNIEILKEQKLLKNEIQTDLDNAYKLTPEKKTKLENKKIILAAGNKLIENNTQVIVKSIANFRKTFEQFAYIKNNINNLSKIPEIKILYDLLESFNKTYPQYFIQQEHYNNKNIINILSNINKIKNMRKTDLTTVSKNDIELSKFLINDMNNKYKIRAPITMLIYNMVGVIFRQNLNILATMGKGYEDMTFMYFADKNTFNKLKTVADKKNETLNNVSDNKDFYEMYSTAQEKMFGERKNNLIFWTDLGKNYSIFKDMYSQDLHAAFTEYNIGKLNEYEVATINEFSMNMSPPKQKERLIKMAEAFAAVNIGINAIKGGINNGPKFGVGFIKGLIVGLKDGFLSIAGLMVAIYIVNVLIPSFIWMAVIISYYIEMSIYMAIFPIGLMFMVFQQYRQSIHRFINMLIGFILMPIILVSLYFIILNIDIMMPMLLREFMPFFSDFSTLSSSFSQSMADVGTTATSISEYVIDKSSDNNTVQNIAQFVGFAIYTVISMMISIVLLMQLFKANDILSKVLSIESGLGQDMFNSQQTLRKFNSIDKTGIAAGVL